MQLDVITRHAMSLRKLSADNLTYCLAGFPYSLFDLSFAGRSKMTNRAPIKAMFLKNMILQRQARLTWHCSARS